MVEPREVQLSLFDERDLVEIRSDFYPSEKLMVYRNSLLTGYRARKCEKMSEVTEACLRSCRPRDQRSVV